MARQDQANEDFSITSFLYGGNAAYIEELHAAYENDPSSVSDDWQAFFKQLKDDAADVKKAAAGASWKNKNWPIAANGELISALDGNWSAVESHIQGKLSKKATDGSGQTAEH